MRVLITGGTGFLGGHVVSRFCAEGYEVVFTGRNQRRANELLTRIPPQAREQLHWLPIDHGSASAASALESAVQDVSVVIHCAALTSPWGNTPEFDRANIVGTREVVDAVQRNGVDRLVHISTPSIYFSWSDQLCISESDHLPPPANDYARSKLAAEHLVHERPARETVILRPRALFGPGDPNIMPRLLRAIQRGPLPIMRSTPILMDLTYIDNAVDAVWLAATKPLPDKLATYNVTNGEPMSLQELLPLIATSFGLRLKTVRLPWRVVDAVARTMEFVARRWGNDEPTFTRYSAGLLAFCQTLDISAIRRDLGYAPAVSLIDGIRRHAEWHRGERTQ